MLAIVAVNAAILLAVFGTPSLAQPPGYQPKGQPGFAQPQQGQPNSIVQPNGLALPPGYRPRTPPQPQSVTNPNRPVATAPSAVPGSGGLMMYFQKPADSMTATGGGLNPATGLGAGTGVAQLNEPARLPVNTAPAPDVAPVPVRLLPQPVPSYRTEAPYMQPPAINIPPATPTNYNTTQPIIPGDMTSTSQKKEEIKPKDVDPKEIQLPPREKIFMVYNDADLERAIMESIGRDWPNVDVKNLKFPPLPVISPPGVSYQPKTATYPPMQMTMESGYVVHRRLHFEERNAERQGWDLGPLSTLVSAGHFYRRVLLWPQSLASGCVYGFWDTNMGKCSPGSPSPYYLYPPGLTLTGSVAEAGIITGASFIFP
jgi:hypothetical protein